MKFDRGAKISIGGLMAAGALLAVAAPALAHVGVDKDEIAAGAATTLSFSFGHGCGESPTTSMKFQIPEGINNAVAQVHPGWDVAIERVDLAEPIESSHGEEITDRPSVITFTAREGFEVPTGVRDTFTLSFTAPEEEGQLFFPIIQGCVVGTNDWIDQWDGTGEEPEHPAPSVMVVAGTGEESGGHGHDEAATDDTVMTDTPTSSADTSSDKDSSDGLAITGIVLGAAGLGAGGFALARGGRKAKSA